MIKATIASYCNGEHKFTNIKVSGRRMARVHAKRVCGYAHMYYHPTRGILVSRKIWFDETPNIKRMELGKLR